MEYVSRGEPVLLNSQSQPTPYPFSSAVPAALVVNIGNSPLSRTLWSMPFRFLPSLNDIIANTETVTAIGPITKSKFRIGLSSFGSFESTNILFSLCYNILTFVYSAAPIASAPSLTSPFFTAARRFYTDEMDEFSLASVAPVRSLRDELMRSGPHISNISMGSE